MGIDRNRVPRCWCGHVETEHGNGRCGACIELGEDHPHGFTPDPAQGPTLPAAPIQLPSVDEVTAAGVEYRHVWQYTPDELRDPTEQPGDEHLVFIVTSGSYSDYGIRAVFVGNRAAAVQFADQYDRINTDKAEVEEHDDVGSGGRARVYYPTYPVIQYTTTVRVSDASIMHSFDQTSLAQGNVVHVSTRAQLAVKGRLVEVVTMGSLDELIRVQKSHSERVAQIRVAIIQSEPIPAEETNQ